MIGLVAALVGGLGLVSILARRGFLGLMVGVQLLFMGATMMFAFAGISAGTRANGYIFALFIVLGGVAQLVGGYALAVRQFYLRGRVQTDDLQTLKQ